MDMRFNLQDHQQWHGTVNGFMAGNEYGALDKNNNQTVSDFDAKMPH